MFSGRCLSFALAAFTYVTIRCLHVMALLRYHIICISTSSSITNIAENRVANKHGRLIAGSDSGHWIPYAIVSVSTAALLMGLGADRGPGCLAPSRCSRSFQSYGMSCHRWRSLLVTGDIPSDICELLFSCVPRYINLILITSPRWHYSAAAVTAEVAAW
jgi:hypothetical protein